VPTVPHVAGSAAIVVVRQIGATASRLASADQAR